MAWGGDEEERDGSREGLGKKVGCEKEETNHSRPRLAGPRGALRLPSRHVAHKYKDGGGPIAHNICVQGTQVVPVGGGLQQHARVQQPPPHLRCGNVLAELRAGCAHETPVKGNLA